MKNLSFSFLFLSLILSACGRENQPVVPVAPVQPPPVVAPQQGQYPMGQYPVAGQYPMGGGSGGAVGGRGWEVAWGQGPYGTGVNVGVWGRRGQQIFGYYNSKESE